MLCPWHKEAVASLKYRLLCPKMLAGSAPLQWLWWHKCSHHKHSSKSCGRALQGKAALSCWLQWTAKWKKVTGEKEGAHQHQVPEMMKSSSEIQKRFSRDFVAAQEATAGSWSRSKAGWKDLLCQHSGDRRRAVSISSGLKPISSSRYNFFLFTELFWCVLEKKFLSRDWQAQDTFTGPNFIHMNDVISYW